MPLYDLAAVAEALDLEPKQLDNLLSRNEIAGVERKKRGVTRRLTTDVAVVIRIARELSISLRIPLGSALPLAQQIASLQASDLELGRFITLRVDLESLRKVLSLRLDSAVEAVGRRRRGRPPRRANSSHLGH